MPRRASSQVHATLQRRSDANDRTRGIERRSVMSEDLRPKRRLSEASESKGSQNLQRHRMSRIASPRKRTDTANSGWEGTNLIYRTARRASLTPQEEISRTGCEDAPRKGREYVDVCSNRTPKTVSRQRDRAETVYSDWEETNFIYRSARDSNLGPQDETSLTEYAEFPPISQHGRRSDRQSYPPHFIGENETPRKDQPSRQARETPWIHTDPPQAIVTYPEPRHIVKREPLSRVSGSDSCRDEELLRRPSTQVQDTYAETSSTRSARRRPRSPQYETPRYEGPVREATRARDTGGSTANGLEALIGVLQAPKVDLPTFKGDPMQYHMFMRAFDDNVERVISDPSSKLARLVQSCTEEAARVIQGCTLMLPERGYVRARQLLKDRYGDEFVIAELWGQRLLSTSNRMSQQ